MHCVTGRHKPHKKPNISDPGCLSPSLSFNFHFFGRNCVTTFPWPGCFKSMLAYVYWWQAQSSFSCRSATYMLKMSGPMIEPCGTPKLTNRFWNMVINLNKVFSSTEVFDCPFKVWLWETKSIQFLKDRPIFYSVEYFREVGKGQ